jgi:hypothetical protein
MSEFLEKLETLCKQLERTKHEAIAENQKMNRTLQQ